MHLHRTQKNFLAIVCSGFLIGRWMILVLSVLSTLLGSLPILDSMSGAVSMMNLIGITLIADSIRPLFPVAYVSCYIKENYDAETIYTQKEPRPRPGRKEGTI